jgi:hypothetical protein
LGQELADVFTCARARAQGSPFILLRGLSDAEAVELAGHMTQCK